MQIEMAWRDERVSVFAMSGLGGEFCPEPPLFVCKKRAVGHRGPFVLDPCRGRPHFQLSRLGLLLQDGVAHAAYPLRFVASIDSYFRIPVQYELFAGLCAEGWFDLWNPSTPMSYFDDAREGYLVLLQVSRLDGEIPEGLLSRGRSGANFIYWLDRPVTAKAHPLLRSARFAFRKQELKAYLVAHGWFLGEEEPALEENGPESEDLFAGLEDRVRRSRR